MSGGLVDRCACDVALKEWGVVCDALGSGQQSILIRKGGISEGSAGFRFEHARFWLFPTRFHATADQLTPVGANLLGQVELPPPGMVPLSLWCETRAVFRITQVERLRVLDGLHILSPETVRARFDYREPGLFVAVVEVFRSRTLHRIVEASRFAGCHSWVDLDAPLECDGDRVVPTAVVEDRVRELTDRLGL